MAHELGIANCLEEREKSFKFLVVGTNMTYWVPKTQIEFGGWKVGYHGTLVVSSWWWQTINSQQTSSGPTPHQQGLCEVCGHPYLEHPELRSQWERPGKYKALCGGCVFNTEISVKTAMGNFHTSEWWLEVQSVRAAMGCWNGEDLWAQHLRTCQTRLCREGRRS